MPVRTMGAGKSAGGAYVIDQSLRNIPTSTAPGPSRPAPPQYAPPPPVTPRPPVWQPAPPPPPPAAPESTTPTPITRPAPVAPPSSALSASMMGLQSAGGGSGDAIHGGGSNLLRQDLGYRQPPSLQALLQGLKY